MVDAVQDTVGLPSARRPRPAPRQLRGKALGQNPVAQAGGGLPASSDHQAALALGAGQGKPAAAGGASGNEGAVHGQASLQRQGGRAGSEVAARGQGSDFYGYWPSPLPWASACRLGAKL